MRNLLLYTLSALLLCASVVQGGMKARKLKKIVNRKTKATLSELKAFENDLKAVEGQWESLKTRSLDMNSQIASNRHTWSATSTDKVLIVDAYLGSGDKCGTQTITGWTSNLDIYYAGSTVTEQTAVTFNTGTGTFTAPAAGWYNICASFRFKKSGNSNDVTIKKNGAVIGAFGNAVDWDWRSSGTCLIQSLAVNDQITVVHESTGGSDCIEETGWYYGRFLVNMIANSA